MDITLLCSLSRKKRPALELEVSKIINVIAIAPTAILLVIQDRREFINKMLIEG